MKKIVSMLLAAALLASVFALTVNAKVYDKDDIIDDGDFCVVLWDRVEVDGAVMGQDGYPVDYLSDHGFAVNGPAEVFGVAGWVGCSQDIIAFGYAVDDGEPVLSADYKFTTSEDVINAAKMQNCDYASRFRIMIDATGLEGTHKYSFLCQLEDQRVFKMSIHDGTELEFMYSADGSFTPTATPDPGDEAENAPMIMLRFDEDEKYIEGGLFSTSVNAIESVEFDAGKKCYVIHMDNASDPWIMMQFAALMMENESYTVDTAKYKILQLGFRISNPDSGTAGQIYFQTDENPGLDEPKAVVFKIQPTDEIQFVNVNMGRNKKWVGTMTDTRLDPFGECKGSCDFEVYYIAFFANDSAATAFAESWLEQGDAVIPTPAPTPVPTEAPTRAPTPEITAVPTAAPTEETQPTEQAQATDTPAKNNNGNPWPVIGIIGGIAVIAAVVAVIVVSKKKKNQKA